MATRGRRRLRLEILCLGHWDVCSQSVNDVVAETQRGGPSKGIFCVDEIVLFTLYAWLTSQPSSNISIMKRTYYTRILYSNAFFAI